MLGLNIGRLQAQERDRFKSIILVWLAGGASQFETFDPKPESPVEIRGSRWGTVRTVTGEYFCEKLPLLAQEADKFTVFRAVQTRDSGHNGGVREYLGTPAMPFQHRAGGVPYTWINDHNSYSIGAVESNHQHALADFKIEWDTATNRYRQPQLRPTVSPQRFDQRVELLEAFQEEPLDRNQQLGVDLLRGGGALQQAFNLPQADLAEYGNVDDPTAHSFCLAERLAERGAKFITIWNGIWDTHSNMYELMAPHLDRLDRALSTLIRRTRDKHIIVAAAGEFGRTPVINNGGGRDHWPDSASAIVTSPTRKIWGSTNRQGYSSTGIINGEKWRKTVLAAAGHSFPGNQIVPAALE